LTDEISKEDFWCFGKVYENCYELITSKFSKSLKTNRLEKEKKSFTM